MEGDQKPDHIDGMQFSGLEVLAHGGRSAVSSDPAVQNPKAGGTKQKEHAQSCVHASSPSESTGLALCGAWSPYCSLGQAGVPKSRSRATQACAKQEGGWESEGSGPKFPSFL